MKWILSLPAMVFFFMSINSHAISYSDFSNIKLKEKLKLELNKCLPDYLDSLRLSTNDMIQLSKEKTNNLDLELPMGESFDFETLNGVFTRNFEGVKCFQQEVTRYREEQAISDLYREIDTMTRILSAINSKTSEKYILDSEIEVEEANGPDYSLYLKNTVRGDACIHSIYFFEEEGVMFLENHCD